MHCQQTNGPRPNVRRHIFYVTFLGAESLKGSAEPHLIFFADHQKMAVFYMHIMRLKKYPFGPVPTAQPWACRAGGVAVPHKRVSSCIETRQHINVHACTIHRRGVFPELGFHSRIERCEYQRSVEIVVTQHDTLRGCTSRRPPGLLDFQDRSVVRNDMRAWIP
jgi:hypothetical protein